MGLLFLAIFASTLAAVLGGPKVTWWTVDSTPLSPPQGSIPQGTGMHQWFSVYPESYEPDDHSRITTTTSPQHHKGGYEILDLRS